MNGSETPFGQFIDHTNLGQAARETDVRKLCDEAVKYGFKAVCVNGGMAQLCAELLRGSSVKLCCVVGFPLGAGTASAKLLEARELLAAGARSEERRVGKECRL